MTSNAIKVRYLEKSYNGFQAVDGASFDVEENTVVGLLGPNGAGKTTIIKCILGLVHHDGGKVWVDGNELGMFPKKAQSHMSAMLEGARNIYWRLTVRENIEFFTSLQGIDPSDGEVRERTQRYIEGLGLEEKENTSVRNLSKGQKQKTSMACMMAQKTPILFLDEPTLGLDVESSYHMRRTVKDLVKEDDRTVVLTSHHMDVVEDVSDKVVIINEGDIVEQGSVNELIDYFDSGAYNITIEGELSESVKPKISSIAEIIRWNQSGNITEFNITLPSDKKLYDVIDVLRTENVLLKDVESDTVDLEKAFLETVNENEREGV
ncbi:MAG: ABC transporter ATP-binding protein [Halobacteria archaeon]